MDASVATTADRQREVLLSRVDALWIDGLLRRSLGDEEAMVLSLSSQPERIDHPWAGVAPIDLMTVEDTSDLGAELVERGDSLLLLGPPGAGKTTTLLNLAEQLLQEARANATAPAPVVLNLSSFSQYRGELGDWIEQELVTKYSLPRRRVQTWLAADAMVLLLDGLDEVVTERRRRCLRAINDFRREHPLQTIVACRTQDYDGIGERLAFEAALEVEPLADVELATDATLDPELRTPLMLGLLASSDDATPDGEDPLAWAYSRYVEHAFEQRKIDPRRRHRIMAGLSWLALAMAHVGTTELWLERIGPRLFVHRWRRWLSMALGLLFIVVACVGVTTGMSVFSGQVASSGFILGLGAVPVVLVFNRGLEIRPVERLQWNWRRALRLLPLSVALGVLVGAIYGAFFILWVNVINGAVLGAVLVITLGLEPADQESRVRPNSGIRRSLAYALTLGPLGGIAGGLALGYVVAPIIHPELDPASSVFGLSNPYLAIFTETAGLMGVIVGMIYGGTAVLLHAAVRLVMALTTPVPLRLVRFLDQAVDLGLMRRIGGGYLFVHRTLRDQISRWRR